MPVQSTNLQHLNQPTPLDDIAAAVRAVMPAHAGQVPLHEPGFDGNEWNYVRDCLDSGWVSTAGQYVERFERALIDYTGIPHAAAVVNGTAALHACLAIAGIQPGDEVLVPAMTFVATANAVSYCQAVPHFVDIESRTLGVDPAKLEHYLRGITEKRSGVTRNRFTGRPLRALIVMHTVGHPVDLEPVVDLCRRYGLLLIEDAAQALGSRYRGRHVGGFGDIAAFSFNGNKIITSGGGGAIVTGNAALARRARHLTTTARIPGTPRLEHDEVAWNYRMPNLNAALGLAQLEQLPAILDDKRRLAGRYADALSACNGVSLFRGTEEAEHNHWLNTIILDPRFPGLRDDLIEALSRDGIQPRPLWTPMHWLPMYGDCPHMELATTEDLFARAVCLPSSAMLGRQS